MAPRDQAGRTAWLSPSRRDGLRWSPPRCLFGIILLARGVDLWAISAVSLLAILLVTLLVFLIVSLLAALVICILAALLVFILFDILNVNLVFRPVAFLGRLSRTKVSKLAPSS